MFIEQLETPEIVTEDGLTATLTHVKNMVKIDPGDSIAPIQIIESKGWVQKDGSFKSWGPHTVYQMDAEGFKAFAINFNGDFKLSDLKPLIKLRMEQVAKAKADAEVKAKAEQDAKDLAFAQQVETQIKNRKNKGIE